MRGAFQNRRTRSMSGGVKPIWAASWLASPPTSRPPIALGCPVSENGDAPGLPIRPVARWQLMMALTLSVPCADWLTPCEYSVTTRGMVANSRKKSATSRSERPVASAVAPILPAIVRARASASSKPLVCRSM